MPSKTSRTIVPSINKAIDILMLLNQNPNLTLKDICQILSLPVSTCYNILTTLELRGLIEKNKITSEYNLGFGLMRLGLQIYNNIDIRKIALPFMKELSQKYDETCYLTTINRATLEGIVLERIESSQTLKVLYQVGSNFPLYASATGKSLLSGFSEKELDNYLNTVKLIPFSEETITEENELRKELEDIRKRGYATTNNDLGNGVTGVSSTVKDFHGKVVAAISLSGPTQRMTDQIPTIINVIQDTANKISQCLK